MKALTSSCFRAAYLMASILNVRNYSRTAFAIAVIPLTYHWVGVGLGNKINRGLRSNTGGHTARDFRTTTQVVFNRPSRFTFMEGTSPTFPIQYNPCTLVKIYHSHHKAVNISHFTATFLTICEISHDVNSREPLLTSARNE